VDTAGNLSVFSTVATATTQSPPTAPTNLSAVVSGVGQITLTWTASTSTVGVQNYIVQRCLGVGCTSFVPIGAPTGTAYNDAALTMGAYGYRVGAVSGDLSAFS